MSIVKQWGGYPGGKYPRGECIFLISLIVLPSILWILYIQHSLYLSVLATDLGRFHGDESSVYFKSCKFMYLQLCKFVCVYECGAFSFNLELTTYLHITHHYRGTQYATRDHPNTPILTTIIIHTCTSNTSSCHQIHHIPGTPTKFILPSSTPSNQIKFISLQHST